MSLANILAEIGFWTIHYEGKGLIITKLTLYGALR